MYFFSDDQTKSEGKIALSGAHQQEVASFTTYQQSITFSPQAHYTILGGLFAVGGVFSLH
jgi:hypothetical protein